MSKTGKILGYILLLVLLASAVTLAPLDKLLEKITAKSQKYVDEFPQEKAYLHVDKPFYAAGDVLWYKAYLTAGAYHQPSPLSKMLYVELLHEEAGLVERQIVQLDSGFGHGDFVLPDTMPQGSYQLRAYTNWMRNFDADYLYTQQFDIFSPLAPPPEATAVNVDLQKIDLQFFPEGGDLIAGIPSIVAFKATDVSGKGVPISGKVLNRSGKTVAVFKDQHLGMGAMSLLPQAGEQYQAVATMPNGEEHICPLPSVKATGIGLSIQNNAKDYVRMTVRGVGEITDPSILIVAHVRGAIQFVGKGNLETGAFSTKIPRKNFSEGIVHLTIFDAKGQAQAERLFFNKSGKKLQISVQTDKQQYGTREKVDMQVEVRDESGQPISANLSLAVTDSGKVQKQAGNESLMSYMLLSSDLKGHVENPGYYFADSSPKIDRALDFLMMTQGWRRFKWSALLEDEFPTIEHYIEQGINIAGQVTRTLSNKPVADGKVTLMVNDSTHAIIVGKTGDKGQFSFVDLSFEDSTMLVLQAETHKGKKDVEIKLDEPTNLPMSPYATMDTTVVPLSKEVLEYLKIAREKRKIQRAFNMEDFILLEGVEITGQRERPEDKLIRIYGEGDAVIRADDLPGINGALHPLQLLQGRVAGVRVSGSGAQYTVSIRSQGTTINGSTEPMIMIDNIPVDIFQLNTLSPRDIETIEVFKDPASLAKFGVNGANGVIAIYTKKGEGIITEREGIVNFQYEGFASPRVFYSPNYHTPQESHAMPDKRATVHWVPNIFVDETGKAAVSFYTSDERTTLQVQVQGLSKAGHVGSQLSSFTVEK